MKKNILFSLIILLSIFSISCDNRKNTTPNTTAKNGIIDLSDFNFSDNKIVPLDGDWEFYWDTLLYPVDFKNDSTLFPEYVKVPGSWNKYEKINNLKSKDGFATFRLKIKLNSDSANYGLQMVKVFSAYKLFVNNNLIDSVGKVSYLEDDEKASFKQSLIFISDNQISYLGTDSSEIDLIFQVSNFHSTKSGLVRKIYFGKYKDIDESYEQKLYISYLIIGILLIIFLYHISLFLLRKQEISYLFFAIICFAMIFRILATNENLIYNWIPSLNFEIYHKLDFILGYCLPLLFSVFFLYLFKSEIHKNIIRSILFLGLGFALFLFITPTSINRNLEPIFIIYALLSGFYLTFIYLPILFINKYQYVYIAFLGMFVFFATGLNDALLSMNIINTPFLMHYGLVFYIITQAFLLSKRSSDSFKSVELLSSELQYKNDNLEIIVKERTSEIMTKNEELIVQQEEILAQREELLSINEELNTMNIALEKLSIVASKTDNSVIISDSKGVIQWCNEGFERMMKMTLDTFMQKFGNNIFQTSSNKQIREIFDECVLNRNSAVYISECLRGDGTNIWTQTTLTPIFDADDKISNIIAIDSDITEIQDASQKIDFQHKQIKSSIQYALTIQQSMLPSHKEIGKYVQNFIIYKPKDIVSGDFYWFFSPCGDNNEVFCKIYFIAAVDCTGHGVPGAFMSVISNNILRKIVLEQRISDPKEILTNIDKEIIKTLRQEETENQDGLDICFCRIITDEVENTNVVFCGAKLPLFVYNTENKSIEKIKGDSKTIGGAKHRSETSFKNTELLLKKHDQIFLSTDGFIDQNNESRKRFGTEKFVNTINECVNLPFENQQVYLENTLKNWQKDEEQRDDITVIGLKF